MAWAIRCSFNRIQSYAQAAKAWEKAVIFSNKNRTSDNYLLVPRGLVDRRKKHLTIERTEAEDFILRLYEHPVVTWHKDHALTICSEASKSTGLFANHCTPAEMFVTGGDQFRVTVDGRTYKVGKQTTFRPRDDTWKPDQITPWSVSRVNRERAKQALVEVGYEEFRLWFKVYIHMSSPPDGRAGWIDNNSIVIMLRDRNKWRDLVTSRFPNAWNYPDQALSEIRQAIYQECKCIDRKSVPFLG